MEYPQELIDEIRNKLDIVDVIDAVVPLRKVGKNYICHCPFHAERTPSFTVNQQEQLYHCFGACGEGGNVFNFYMQYHQLTFPEAVRQLAQKAGVALPQQSEGQREENRLRSRIYETLEKAAQRYVNNLTQIKHPVVNKALFDREVTSGTIDKFRLGAALPEWRDQIDHLGGIKNLQALNESGLVIYEPKTEERKGKFYDRFRNAIIFPVRDEKGRVVAFAQRRLDHDDNHPNQRVPPKYINSPETTVFKKRELVYGLYEALQANASPDTIIVTEGYMDVVMSHQGGMTNTVATMGTAITQPALRRLYRYSDRLVFCFDGDRAGYAASQRALFAVLPLLDDTKQAEFVYLPNGHDPDSMIRERGAETYLAYLNRAATPASALIMDLAKGNSDLSNVEARAQMFSNAKQMLDVMPPSTTKAVLMAQLENITGIRPTEYLPISLQMQTGHFNGVEVSQLEGEIREFISRKIGVSVADVRVDISVPEISPSRTAVTPSFKGLNVRQELISRMREVAKILTMQTQVAEGVTLNNLLQTARQGTGESKVFARGLLNRYARESNTLDVHCQLVISHLRVIKEYFKQYQKAEQLDSNLNQQLTNWLNSTNQKVYIFSEVEEYMDSIRSAHFLSRIQEIISLCASEIEKAPDLVAQATYPHSINGEVART